MAKPNTQASGGRRLGVMRKWGHHEESTKAASIVVSPTQFSAAARVAFSSSCGEGETIFGRNRKRRSETPGSNRQLRLQTERL